MTEIATATATARRRVDQPPPDFVSIVKTDPHLDVDASGNLMIEGVTADAILEEFGSPCYVVSEATLRRNFTRFRDAFAGRWPTGINVLYAIKANNNLAIRAILHQEGAGGDCFGAGELYATFAGGADPDKIVMNGSSKRPAELIEAVRLGVRINIDNEQEIDFLAAIVTELDTVARVNVRLKVLPARLDRHSDYFDTNLLGYVEQCQWGYEAAEAGRLVQRILTTPGLELEGYHLHVGRGVNDLAYFEAWAAEMVSAVAQIRDRTGFEPTLLDIGGGYPRQRDPESRSLALNDHAIEDYAEVVTTTLLRQLAAAGVGVPRLWLEPGRYIVGNAVLLLGTVDAIKHDLGKVWVNADFSINNLMRIETSGSAYHVVPAARMRDVAGQRVDIVGPLCVGAPIGARRMMPELAVGDRLAVLDSGMYAETASTQLNGVPRPATVLVNGGNVDVIKRRESVADVFANHQIPLRLLAGGIRTH